MSPPTPLVNWNERYLFGGDSLFPRIRAKLQRIPVVMFIISKIIQHHICFEIPSDILARTNLSTYFQLIFKLLSYHLFLTINDPANLPLKEPLDYRAINYLPLVNWLNVESFLVNFSFVVFKPFTLLSHLLKSIFFHGGSSFAFIYFFSVCVFCFVFFFLCCR